MAKGKGNSVYQIVTDKIKAKLAEGTVPWRKPWTNAKAVNWKTQKPYRGINTMLLDPGEYATFKQITEAGGKVKKGAKSHLVVFWKWIEVQEKDEQGEPTGEKVNVPFLRYYNVFEINSQVEGLQSKRKEEKYNHDPIVEAENIIESYKDRPEIRFQPGRAYYQPANDFISLPGKEDFPVIHEYYSTLFHEAVHSTGHEKRLNRLSKEAVFGNEVYSKEELVAEIGAAMLCGVAGIDNSTIDNSASYINNWMRKLDDDPKLIVHAAAAAQKAVDYIRGVKHEEV